jgi:hypothetical protein
MASRSFSFELESAPEQSAAGCRRALRDLGWEVSVASDGRLVAREDLALLRCMEGPIDLELRLLPRADDRTEIVLEATMVGRGPIQSKRLRERIPALERQIQRKVRLAKGESKR